MLTSSAAVDRHRVEVGQVSHVQVQRPAACRGACARPWRRRRQGPAAPTVNTTACDSTVLLCCVFTPVALCCSAEVRASSKVVTLDLAKGLEAPWTVCVFNDLGTPPPAPLEYLTCSEPVGNAIKLLGKGAPRPKVRKQPILRLLAQAKPDQRCRQNSKASAAAKPPQKLEKAPQAAPPEPAKTPAAAAAGPSGSFGSGSAGSRESSPGTQRRSGGASLEEVAGATLAGVFRRQDVTTVAELAQITVIRPPLSFACTPPSLRSGQLDPSVG